MVTQLVPGVDDLAANMAAIGHVCIQWSLCENNILAVLCAIEGLNIDHAAIVFGGLDMKPRLNMAINLATHHKIDPRLKTRLRNLRTAMDKANLADRRNRAVHGVQKASETPHTFTMYMPRLKGDAQHRDVSIMEMHQLGLEIKQAGDEAWSIFEAYGLWKFGKDGPKNITSEFMTAPTGIIASIKQYFRARTKGRWG